MLHNFRSYFFDETRSGVGLCSSSHTMLSICAWLMFDVTALRCITICRAL